MRPVSNTEFTDSSEKSMGSVENGGLPKKSLQTKEVTSNSKGGAGRQQGSGRNSYYPNNSYYNYNYAGYTATDSTSQAPQTSYGFQPSGIMKYYGPAEGIYPPCRYPKHGQFPKQGQFPKRGQFQIGRSMEPKSNGRIWNESANFKSREKPTEKGDSEPSYELTCSPRVNRRNDNVDSASVPLGVSGSEDKYNVAEFGRIWNESANFKSREKPAEKGDSEASYELTCGPRVNRRNDNVDSASVPLGVSGSEDKYNVAEFGRIWNESGNFKSREKPTEKGDSEASYELTCGPRVNRRNDNVDSASVPLGVSGSEDKYNVAEFQTEYEKAKFYVIKSYSEDDVHKCIKYNVWSSTAYGNKKLDAAFHDAEVKNCHVFLFFSVNASGQFVGLAEMIGKVDYNKSMDFWQLDKWSGFFPVKWHIIKDIPNAKLRHILLDNNGNRPVTFTRDTQEVGLKEGLEMLKIFKNYAAKSSLLDDFEFYEERRKGTSC